MGHTGRDGARRQGWSVQASVGRAERDDVQVGMGHAGRDGAHR